jgi:2-methylisocitrate lyase-like PEP mutase family enzyme
MRSQTEKAHAFVALHARPGAFVIPNPWDAGTAKLLAAMGFEALATTSLGLANTLGTAEVSLEAIIENCRTIAAATDLPVSADLENCGADEPKAAALAIGLAAEAGGSADRLRIRRAIRNARSTISRLPSSACRPRSRPRARCRFRSR